MKQKILVIGATGLVGNAVAKQLNSDGYNVVVMSRSRAKA
ncbi:MAG: NAD-dependent epimerase/dehydratase family protein, partial [Candidatus Thorarchaeota archaeon]